MSITDDRKGCTTLREYMDLNGGRLSEAEVIECARQILDALRIMHAKGYVHSKIRPSHVLLSHKGIRLKDFNVSQLVQKPSTRHPFSTQAESNAEGLKIASNETTSVEQAKIENMDYQSPEQQAGHIDYRSDLFAVGILCYRCLTGKSVVSVQKPSEIVPGINPDWDWWIGMAISTNPADCFESAQAMAAEIPLSESNWQPHTPGDNLTEHIETQMNNPHQVTEWKEPIANKYFWHLLSLILIAAIGVISLFIYFLPKLFL